MEIGQRIKEARLAKGHTQTSLAAAADLGALFISELERGVRKPSVSTIIKLSDVLGVSTDYILKGVPTVSVLEEKLRPLTLKQKKAAVAILNAYIDNL